MNRKDVDGLQVFDRETDTAIPLNASGELSLTAVDSIALPLPIDGSIAEYRFTRTSNGAVNPDDINFTYNQDQIYLNRACGFKAIFNDLDVERITENPVNPWITNVLIRNNNVTSNQDIHVEIRH